ncbi:LysR substrate-binding domain-containing protein [Nostoc sp. UHCC 0870]|uniref:LysR substrate-binding domain-containing protein n=1 Tax=Nostoc sp. UHCC 0870 TaxID=2914041 RepID=UPI001EDD1712|nr:LysR substrate-binding domain-containing protein [Nostoc sp. UHCC 0870]UKO99053.1 LysR substrate-binding domain-containing protein [Nostoc sp. UHCC 0870]
MSVMIEIRHLRYFIAVAEELNFSRAAERLNIAQPPLSQQIQALEAELRLQLFERHRRPLRLTSAGNVFLKEARLVLTTLEKAVISARQASLGEIGSLIVAVNSTIANSVLPEILRTFRDRYPQVRLILREVMSSQQSQQLHNSQIDVGFDCLLSNGDTGLSSLEILQEPIVIALPENHPLAKQPEISLKALVDEPFVLPSPDVVLSYGQIIELYQEEVGLPPKVVQEATWLITVLSLVAGGVGVTLLPANAQNLQRTGVVYRPIQGKNLTRPIAAVWRSDDMSVILQNFLQVIKDVVPDVSPEQ